MADLDCILGSCNVVYHSVRASAHVAGLFSDFGIA